MIEILGNFWVQIIGFPVIIGLIVLCLDYMAGPDADFAPRDIAGLGTGLATASLGVNAAFASERQITSPPVDIDAFYGILLMNLLLILVIAITRKRWGIDVWKRNFLQATIGVATLSLVFLAWR